MSILQIVILAVIQGLAELLPVSSSAHVITAEKMMRLDPTSPEMTLLLVMLHTGTMFAVIVYYWQSWRKTYFNSMPAFRSMITNVTLATLATGAIGLLLLQIIKITAGHNQPDFEIESLFGNAKLVSSALAAAGLLIIVSSRFKERKDAGEVSRRQAVCIGAVQGLCLPFRGFSRSGATISTGLALGVLRQRAEEFSFALAVALTPAVIVKEVHRLLKAQAASGAAHHDLLALLGPSLFGMVLSFLAGVMALKWLSRWLEQDRWHLFGGYCLFAAACVLWIG